MLACSGACSHTLVFDYHLVNGTALVEESVARLSAKVEPQC